LLFSRAARLIAVWLIPNRAILTVPSPFNRGVTSISTQVFPEKLFETPTWLPGGGALLYVIAVSSQLLSSTLFTVNPAEEELLA
jgi:hypothetical protein